MCLCTVYLIALFMLHAAWSQRAPTWDECGCRWDAWQGWSTCSRLCYGRQVRERQVWVSDSCGTFRHCDGGDGAYDYRDCNTRCTYGSYNSSYGGCRCPAGRYGTCCDNVKTCGTPQTTSNGAVTVNNGNNYGSVATYTCKNGYNMTGTATMTCSTYDSYSTYWTGSTPRCLFAESCNSSPCQNGGTCVNGLEMYTCVCSPGWSGINCEADVQPPVMSGCEDNDTLHTADHELTHEWTVPAFTDPFGNYVDTTTNYVNNSYRFPWGDFFVQYVATKTNNGLQTECKFQLSIRPYPCTTLNLSVPEFGYVACNGWRQDFGQYCLIGCLANRTLPRDIDGSQWYACGAGGTWSSNPGTIQCEDEADPIGASSGILGSPGSCDDVSAIKEQYIAALKKSEFNPACLKHTDMCVPANVNIRC